MNALDDRLNPYALWLWITATASLVLAGVLGLLALQESQRYLGDAGLVVALNTWSNYLLVFTAIAYVGAAVLGGARWLLRAPAAQPAVSGTSASHADGH